MDMSDANSLRAIRQRAGARHARVTIALTKRSRPATFMRDGVSMVNLVLPYTGALPKPQPTHAFCVVTAFGSCVRGVCM